MSTLDLVSRNEMGKLIDSEWKEPRRGIATLTGQEYFPCSFSVWILVLDDDPAGVFGSPMACDQITCEWSKKVSASLRRWLYMMRPVIL